MKRAFTFIELIIVIALLAGLLGISAPNIKEMLKRKKAAQSGQYLKALNTALTQWSIDHFGPPTIITTTDGSVTAIPATGISDGFYTVHELASDTDLSSATADPMIKALFPYLNNPTLKLFRSPSLRNGNSYIYLLWIDDSRGEGNEILSGIILSRLDSNKKYEPKGFKGTLSTNSFTVPQSRGNGYEDPGKWPIELSQPKYGNLPNDNTYPYDYND